MNQIMVMMMMTLYPTLWVHRCMYVMFMSIQKTFPSIIKNASTKWRTLFEESTEAVTWRMCNRFCNIYANRILPVVHLQESALLLLLQDYCLSFTWNFNKYFINQCKISRINPIPFQSILFSKEYFATKQNS